VAVHAESSSFGGGGVAGGGGSPAGARPAQRSAIAEAAQPANVTVVRSGEKVGRNDPCPCGSGKKYKHCHGA
jgi:hypothetical protein